MYSVLWRSSSDYAGSNGRDATTMSGQDELLLSLTQVGSSYTSNHYQNVCVLIPLLGGVALLLLLVELCTFLLVMWTHSISSQPITMEKYYTLYAYFLYSSFGRGKGTS